MPKLGVVTCQILELEFAHVLSRDPDVSEIWVLHDDFSEELIRVLEKDKQRPVQRVRHANEFETDEINGIAVLIRVMEVGLHSNIPNLTSEVTTAVKELAPFVDSVLLGYGLCGNALKNTNELFKDIPVRPQTYQCSSATPEYDRLNDAQRMWNQWCWKLEYCVPEEV